MFTTAMDVSQVREYTETMSTSIHEKVFSSCADYVDMRLAALSGSSQRHDKSLLFARYAALVLASRGAPTLSIVEDFSDSAATTRVLKSAVAAGTTTDPAWAGPLSPELRSAVGDFIAVVRPRTILGRLAGTRNVPLNTRIPRQTLAAGVSFVGQSAPVPMSAGAFDAGIVLDPLKVCGLVAFTSELARLSSPAAATLFRDDLAASVASFIDATFIDPANAGTTDVTPAAITHGATVVHSSGSTVTAICADIKALCEAAANARCTFLAPHLVMSPQIAIALAAKRDTNGFAFPTIDVNGGTLLGIPVIVSGSVPSTSSDSIIALIDGTDVIFGEDGTLDVSYSKDATIQMNSAPDNPSTASTVMVSLWQRNLVGLRVGRYMNWTRARDAGIAYLDGVDY